MLWHKCKVHTFTGAELRNWLLFFSLPVLREILPKEYLSHLVLLICAIFIFTSENISHDRYTIARGLLIQFHKEFSDLYGKYVPMHILQHYSFLFFHAFIGVKATSMNVHLLQHLPECVCLWGPLWAYSCFHFENLNGFIKSLFHGTRDMTKQVYIYSLPCRLIVPSCIHTACSLYPRY